MVIDRVIEVLFEGIQRHDVRCAAEMMSLIESENYEAERCLMQRYPQLKNKAHIIGITGWPGVGKSTLSCRIAQSFLSQDKLVGIVAIDPSSPISGGSVLGDRERMKAIDGDERLFIRSIASRGHPGGISKSAAGVVKVMEAMGKEIILLETVGVGQDQTSVIHLTDTVIFTLMPGMGDYLQAMKAGVLEIADIFVVNKADKENADQTVMDLEMNITSRISPDSWKPSIIKTIAVNGTGIDELMAQIKLHGQFCQKTEYSRGKKQKAAIDEIIEILKSRCLLYLAKQMPLYDLLEQYAQSVCNGKIDSYSAADMILKDSGIGEHDIRS